MGRKVIKSYARAQAVGLYNNSKTPMSMDEVFKRLNISKSYAFNAMKKYKETGKFVDKKCTGRPQKLNEYDQ